ncbi:ALBINO3-like protein 3, mitochondrial [Beta vulgaris subsp. vulgaris]|uniref:ALBINO3-like protein 3, mitochondrial n=1 Tax=Beta vulgaris subsp. vulgaris TaxID=3555 RepID=UPI002036D09B|nr:ALBINO3-like protein 3, mitochondrial [Beta vulgaris subsp. vulgaris]
MRTRARRTSPTTLTKLCLQHPVIGQKLGLSKQALNVSADHERNESESRSAPPDAPRKRGPVSAHNLSPLELVELSIDYLAAGRINRALPLLRKGKNRGCFGNILFYYFSDRLREIAESFAHLERLRDIKVPEESTAKARYYEGLMVFACFLVNEGRKDEAAQYLRMASVFDPQYNVHLENLEKDADNFVGDLTSSRRADY